MHMQGVAVSLLRVRVSIGQCRPTSIGRRLVLLKHGSRWPYGVKLRGTLAHNDTAYNCRNKHKHFHRLTHCIRTKCML